MYDNNATGDTGTAFVRGTALDTLDAVVMSLQVEEADGDTQTYIELDGLTETVDVLKPLTAPSVDGGTQTGWVNTHTVATLVLDDAPYTDVCNLTLGLWSGGATISLEIDLWAEGDCQDETSKGKQLTLVFYQTGLTITVDPGASDHIMIPGHPFGASGNPTTITTNDAEGESITWRSIEGISATADYWFPVAYIQAGSDVWSTPTP